MPEITLLDKETIDKIAAGEVVERPSSVVKELVENAIDARATAVTVEIKNGGISFIRITDNGCGIEHSQVPLAFLRHSTSKIRSVEDLLCVRSLGFRGEALSSIAAVSQVELITKTSGALTGTRYVIEGSVEKENEEVGAPDGTTFIVRNLFYNTPARQKFLKTAQTEGNYVNDLLERLALSHPDVSFKFINNGQTKMHTAGNANEKDMIYHIYGRDITAALLPINKETEYFHVSGFIGKPLAARGNRNCENYFINGRYIKSALLAKAVEEAYRGFLMQRQYPFCVLYFTMDTGLLDVNVHPTKMELRFANNEEIYRSLCQTIREALTHRELIPEASVGEKKDPKEERKNVTKPKLPEPFEKRRLNDIRAAVAADSPYEKKYPENRKVFDRLLSQNEASEKRNATVQKNVREDISYMADVKGIAQEAAAKESVTKTAAGFDQQNFLTQENGFLTQEAVRRHKIIGQLFNTYWLIEYEDKLFIIDQHAAHEKVLFEKNMERIRKNEFVSQTLSPPIILTLNLQEQELLERYRAQIEAFGYVIEPFGGKEYAVNAVPADFTDIDVKSMFLEMLNDFGTLNGKNAPDLILEKVASMSCKAAVKGNQHLTRAEMEQLVTELLGLKNPYQCPHGRPTIISMSRYEIEKKFKRIV